MVVISFFLIYKKTFEVKNNTVVYNNMCMSIIIMYIIYV